MSDSRKSSFRLPDVSREAAVVVAQRPIRTILTALGTILGVGAFVVTIGLAATARAQVSSRFDTLKATEVRVRDDGPGTSSAFPPDVDERLEALNGVRHAGLMFRLPDSPASRPSGSLGGSTAGTVSIPVIAATPGAVAATHPVIAGRLFDKFHQQRSERVAVVGRVAAQQLGIDLIDPHTFIFLGDISYVVIGRLDEVDRDPDLLLSVIIPESTGSAYFDTSTVEREVLIDTAVGAAQLIGEQAAVVLRPQEPSRLQTLVPPDPATLRNSVESDVQALFLVLAGVALVIGAVAITNATLINVIERRPEIGLRRALGATRAHIVGQITLEAALVGTIAGLVGTSLGILGISVVAVVRGWSATIDLQVVAISPLIGILTGALAGIAPAFKASRTPPAETLRQ